MALSDLDENDFKILKFHLRDRTLLGGQGLARGELEGLSRVDLASRLVLMYGAQEAVKVVCKVLQVMNLLELVDQLSHICLNGEYSRGQAEVRVALDAPSSVTFVQHFSLRSSFTLALCPAWEPLCLRVLVALVASS